MKVIISFLIFIVSISCSSNLSKNDATIHFDDPEYNFGTIPLKEEKIHRFHFSNPGETPVIIYNVKTSCGCAVSEWPRRPIKPKSAGEITVKYDASSPGMFHKEIRVFYNGPDSPAVLKIKGQVNYPDQ